MMDGNAALYRTIWRWHFYAGLLVIPFVFTLSLSGLVYLFKPQIDHWQERAFAGQPLAGAVSPSEQLSAVRVAYFGAKRLSWRLPERPGDAAMVTLVPVGGQKTDVFVSPQGRVLGEIAAAERIPEIAKKVHGELLLGSVGSWAIELAGSWAIVMILSGLYLWWPRGRGAAGTVWPRLRLGRRTFWRDIHAVTGFWVAGLALVLLVTGLPWAGVWGQGFKMVRQQMGWVQQHSTQDWKIGASRDAHAGHGGGMGHDMSAMVNMPMDDTMFDQIVGRATAARMAFPVTIRFPGTPVDFSGKAPPQMQWTAMSEAQDRVSNRTIVWDEDGRQTSDTGTADKHVIDQVVAAGIGWHEGQLLGWFNQAAGAFTALSMLTMAVSGFVLWRRRKPQGGLGAPASPALPARLSGVVAITLGLALFLPLLALSLAVLAVFDGLLLPRLPALAQWLGVRPDRTLPT